MTPSPSQDGPRFFREAIQPLVDQIADYAIYMVDLNGAIRSWNNGAKAILGYSAAEIIGIHSSQLYTKADRLAGNGLKAFKATEAHGRYEEEGQRVRKDGTLLATHLVVYPLRDNTGAVVGYTNVLRDITDEQQTKRALHDSERRFRLLVGGIADYAICMLDTNGIVTSWNRGAQRIKGYTAQEIIGQHFSRFYTDEDRRTAKPFAALKMAAETGRHEDEGMRVRNDGSVFAANVAINSIPDEAGKVAGYAMITRDITERQQVTRALRDTENRFRLLIESVTDHAIYTLDSTGIVTSWNAGAERITGYSAEEIVGEHFSMFYTEHDRREERPYRAMEIARSRGSNQEEGVRVRKDGSLFAADIVIYAIRDEDGRISGFAKIIRDITERKQREFAESANAAKSRFLAHISHEFRTPLNAIIGFSEIIKKEMLGEIPNKRYVSYGQDIHYSGLHLLDLVTHILDLTRIEAGKMDLAFESIDVKPLLEQVLRLVGPAAKSREISLSLDVAQNVFDFTADERMARQCLINLVDNAIKFSHLGGAVKVVARRDDAWLRFLVIDQGIGMAEEDIPVALQPFRQIGDVMTRNTQGAGLGLALVKSYCELHGGGVAVRSKLGTGTEVTLRFPYPGGKRHQLSVA